MTAVKLLLLYSNTLNYLTVLKPFNSVQEISSALFKNVINKMCL